jgi:hypothetical protein
MSEGFFSRGFRGRLLRGWSMLMITERRRPYDAKHENHGKH